MRLINRRFILPFLPMLIACIGITASVQAQTPAPAAPVAVPAVVVQQAPVAPPAPAVPAVPARQALADPAAPRRREDEIVVAPPAVPGQSVQRPGVFQRAAAYLQGREAIATEITQRDARIKELTQQLSQRDSTINQLTTELTELRTGRDQLQQAMARIEGEQRNVGDALASIGFDSSKLPGQASLDQASENTVEGIQEKLKQETDPVKRGELMQRMMAVRDGAKK